MSDEQKLNLKNDILDSVEEYKFEPIKGYPMLHWKGKRPFTFTQYYPAQLKENHGEEVNGWMNKIFWGDNIQVMSHLLKEFRGKIDLVYIDPPFDSKADYKKSITLKSQLINNDHSSFEEKQYADIWTNDEYLQFIYERILLCRELLSESGSFYLHCDWHQNGYIRLILDEIFGKNNIVNEIIWKRGNPRGNASNHYSINTDTIFIYKKSDGFLFKTQYTEHNDGYLDKYYNKIDEKTGKRFQPTPLIGHAGTNKTYEWRGYVKPWRYPIHRLEELDIEGRIYWPETGKGVPRYKKFIDETKGRPVQSLWDDLPQVNSQAIEDTGYPTQKPINLLERVILTSSKPGDLIFDCFMGSGTTQVVAMKLGRRFLGADINLGSIHISTQRLLNTAKELNEKNPQLDLKSENGNSFDIYYTGFSVYNVNNYDIFRNPVQAKDLLKQALEIQPLPNNNLYDGEKDGRMVKIMPVNRIATRADLNELIAGFNYKEFEKKNESNPGKPVEFLLLVCMGHEPDLKAHLEKELPQFKIDVEVVDILRDKSNLEFKRDSEAQIEIENGKLVIKEFYPMNLLQKLSIMKDNVEDWKELTESVMVDFNYDGAVFEPKLVDVPEKNELVKGIYPIPNDAGTIRVKITDLLSESIEMEVQNG